MITSSTCNISSLNPLRLLLPRAAAFGGHIFSGLVLAALFAFTGCATKNASQPAPVIAPPTHAEVITLREGDTLRIAFPDSPNLDTTQIIRRDGKITLPLVGEVQAASLTPDALHDSLIKLYTPQIGDKEITVAIESSSFPVYVTGAVVHPGRIESDHPLTALEAVMEAGGFNYTTANMREVTVIRNESGVMKHYRTDLKRELEDNHDVTPFFLKPGDIIYVPERLQLF